MSRPTPGRTKAPGPLEEVECRVSLGPSAIRIRGLDAKGGTFHIQGHYVREKAKTDGAFLIESGILSVGVELNGKAARIRPLFAKKWFAKQGDGGSEVTAPSSVSRGPS